MAPWRQNSIGRGLPREAESGGPNTEAPGVPDAGSRRAKPRLGVVRADLLSFVNEIGWSAWHRTARGLLHSRSAFVIRLPLTARDRRHLGCGCSSVVEHDLAKVGVEGSSPFARSRFSQYLHRLSRSPSGTAIVGFSGRGSPVVFCGVRGRALDRKAAQHAARELVSNGAPGFPAGCLLLSAGD